MSSKRAKWIFVTDASVLINLIHVDRLYLLGALLGYEFIVPPEVEAEVRVPSHFEALERAFDERHLCRQAFTTTEELALFTQYTEVIGRGEATCLAMAEVKGWHVASDERRKFMALANTRLGKGHVLNTPGLFVLGIQAKVISLEQADQDKLELEDHRFKMQFSSFREGTHNSPSTTRMQGRPRTLHGHQPPRAQEH